MVTIVTATCGQRIEELVEVAIPSVQSQTYPHVEHVIVNDGPSAEMWDAVLNSEGNLKGRHPIRYFELGHNWHAISGDASWGCEPRAVGGYLAHGEYIGYIDDDDELLPDHCQLLVELIERTESDFVYSQMQQAQSGAIYGRETLEYGQIGTPMVLHKVELLHSATWRADGYGNDGRLFLRWARLVQDGGAGASYAYLPKVTVRLRPHWKKK